MYRYNEIDQKLVDERVEQFRDQTRRYLAGELNEEEFLALRLMNGLYVQRHAPMLRIAVPYGLLNAEQLRKLAYVARTYDKGFGHFTTRTNLQLNWPKIEDVPDILAELAKVQMHAIQTSGNCIRNTTTDRFAGVAPDEIEDPRPYCEIIRQWAALNPEFAYMPRKFKIAVVGGPNDRSVSKLHDVGLRIVHNEQGETGFEVWVGGGLGRTPIIAKKLCDFLPRKHLLTYLEAIVRLFNLYSRRDNKYKARIKILVQTLGIDAFREKVDAEWAKIRDGVSTIPEAEFARLKAAFSPFDYDASAADDTSFQQKLDEDEDFRVWVERNTHDHKVPGYRAVTAALKPQLQAPGDITSLQMEVVADLAEKYSFGEVRSTYDQNLLLADVRQGDLYTVWKTLAEHNMARPVVGTVADVICCPGFDLCGLANAHTYNIAKEVMQTFDDLDYLYDLGPIRLNMSGCINACAHHHVGNIGILGVDRRGEDYYQILLGGNDTEDASLAKTIGKALPAEAVVPALKILLKTYVDLRQEEESFLETLRRVGPAPFKENVYAAV